MRVLAERESATMSCACLVISDCLQITYGFSYARVGASPFGRVRFPMPLPGSIYRALRVGVGCGPAS